MMCIKVHFDKKKNTVVYVYSVWFYYLNG